MKLRVRVGKGTLHLTLEEERPTLGDLRRKLSECLLPSLGYSSDAAFTITLNGRDALAVDEDSLESCRIVSGDLIVVLMDPAAPSLPVPPPAQLPITSSSVQTSSTTSIRDDAGPGAQNVPEPGPSTSHGSEQEDDMVDTKSWYMSEPMLCSESVDGKIPHSLESLYISADCTSANDVLMVVIHLLMLETGYKERGVRGKTTSMPEDWRRSDGVYNLRYSHPLCCESPAALICVPMGNLLVVSATLNIDNRLKCVKTLQLPTSSFISFPGQENNTASMFRDLQKLSHQFKDQLIYPLLAAARQALGLPDVFGLVVLPLEIKLRIICLLDIRSILSLASTCKDLQANTEDPSIWRFLYMRDFKDKTPRNLHTDWKQLYQEKKKQKSAILRRRYLPYPPDLPMPYRPSPFAPDRFPPNFPYPPGIIGGEYDQRPLLPLARRPHWSFLDRLGIPHN